MKLYDSLIQQTEALYQGQNLRRLPLDSHWPSLSSKPFIFPEDAALELGGEEPSGYFIAFTSNPEGAESDGSFLLGKDLGELKGQCPYAHIVIIVLSEETPLKDQELYRLLRNIEYARYHVFPEGFSLRVNTNELKEGGRLSKTAAAQGFSLADLAAQFQKAYHADPRVKAVKQIFVTDPSFPYEKLRELSSLDEGITLTLDHILKNLKMDCQTCSYKSICDTVEGMKELHQRERAEKKD